MCLYNCISYAHTSELCSAYPVFSLLVLAQTCVFGPPSISGAQSLPCESQVGFSCRQRVHSCVHMEITGSDTVLLQLAGFPLSLCHFVRLSLGAVSAHEQARAKRNRVPQCYLRHCLCFVFGPSGWSINLFAAVDPCLAYR